MEISFWCQAMAVVFIISLLVLLLVFLYDAQRNAIFERLNLPGPKPTSYIENLLYNRRKTAESLHYLQLEYMQKYGKIFTWYYGSNPDIVVGDPETLKQLLTVCSPKFRENTRESIYGQKYLFNDKVTQGTDEKWSPGRNTMDTVFVGNNIRKVVCSIDEAINTFSQKLHGIANTGLNINILQWFEELTMDIFFLTYFGLRSDVQRNPNSDVFKMFCHLKEEINTSHKMVPFGSCIKNYFKRASNTDLFSEFLSEVINQRREESLQYGIEALDFLDVMLSRGGELGLNENQIITQNLASLLHGHQASSSTLGFVAYHLTIVPGIQEKLRREIELAIQDGKEASVVDSNIEYLDCVINESQRLYPPFCFITRTCVSPCIIHNIKFTAGSQVTVPIYALHNDPDAWVNVDHFDPERFQAPAKGSRHPYQFLPFGAGPRRCIGSALALLVVKLVLVRIVRKFRFVRTAETEVPLTVKTISDQITPKHGIFMKVEMVQ